MKVRLFADLSLLFFQSLCWSVFLTFPTWIAWPLVSNRTYYLFGGYNFTVIDAFAVSFCLVFTLSAAFFTAISVWSRGREF